MAATTRTVTCRECDWEGEEDVLDEYKCPQCGSRALKTEGSPLSQDDVRNPPRDAAEGEDFSGE